MVRDCMCQEHGDTARRVTQTKEVWTRNKRTGLYYNKRRKVIVVRCNGTMGTFVGQLNGAGVSTGTAGDRGLESLIQNSHRRKFPAKYAILSQDCDLI